MKGALVDFSRPVVCILGLPFDAVTLDDAVRRVREAAFRRIPLLLSTANLNFVIAALRDDAFRQSVVHSQLSLADGMPIVWISRLLGLSIPERVPGSGLFEKLSSVGADSPVRVYFFGAPAGVAEEASARVNDRAGGVRCVGYQAPDYLPVGELSTPLHIEPINAADPDFVVLSLGAEKGQAWIEHNRERLSAPIVSHLGAVVGFAAGSLRRAPRLLQRVGLEWLWRIKEEPKLWRRYWNDGRMLAQLMLLSVLPLWWQRVRGPRAAPEALTPCSGERRGPHCFELRTGTVCGAEQMPALRRLLEQAAHARCGVVVDMTGTSYLDSQAMGSLLLLYGYQRDIGHPLSFENVSPELAKVFRLHCSEFLLGPRSVRVPPLFVRGAEADAS